MAETAQEILDALLQQFESLRQALDNVSDVSGFVDNFTKFRERVIAAKGDVSNVDAQMNTLTKSTGQALSLITKFSAFDNLTGLSATIGGVNSQFQELKTTFGSVASAIESIMPSMAKKIIDSGLKISDSFLQNAEQGAKLESNYLQMMAATGQLGGVFDAAGSHLENLTDLTIAYANNLGNMSKASGMSYERMIPYITALQHIPGVMQDVISSTGKAADNQSAFVAALKLSAAAGIDSAQTSKILNTAYEQLSNGQGKVTDGTQKGTTFFSYMIEATDKLKIRFSDAEGYLTKVANAFEYIGDNTEAATKILGQYTDALRATGLSSKSTVEMIGNMTEAVSKLSVGTKALISARSGGPGGLQGAFRIDRLMREGKEDQVLDMLTQTIKKQFGGRIVTREESDRSPQAAAQFFKQQQMLQSGAFGSLAKTPDQAARLIDVLASGNLAAGKKLISGKEEVATRALSRGEELQSQNNTLLNQLNQSIKQNSAVVAVSNNKKLKDWFGTGLHGSEQGKKMRQSMEEAGEFLTVDLAASKGAGKGIPATAEMTQLKAQKRALPSMVDEFSSLGVSTANMAGDAGNFIKKQLNTLGQKIQTHALKNNLELSDAIKSQLNNVSENKIMPAHLTVPRRQIFDQNKLATRLEDRAQPASAINQTLHRTAADINVNISAPQGFDIETSIDQHSSAAIGGGVVRVNRR